MSDDTIHYYELVRREIKPAAPGEFVIMTTALIQCDLCDAQISGMGGPGHGSICKSCGDHLRRGGLRGTVVCDRALEGPEIMEDMTQAAKGKPPADDRVERMLEEVKKQRAEAIADRAYWCRPRPAEDALKDLLERLRAIAQGEQKDE
jgi:hypothetical protein